MASLLVELLYLRGEDHHDSLTVLPLLFHQHFGFPLPLSLFDVNSVADLLALREIQTHIQVSNPLCLCVCVFVMWDKRVTYTYL